MNYNSLGKAARNEFYETRLKEKNIQLLETISKHQAKKHQEKETRFG